LARRLTNPRRLDESVATEQIGKIAVPTLVFVGNSHAKAVVEISVALADRIPNAHIRGVDGGGQLPNMECPDTINNAVIDFLFALTEK
jgi:pimeloyl-ACP methyl ester carboxylesterase